MACHFLVVTDGSFLSDYSAAYLGGMYGGLEDMEFTVLHVAEPAPSWMYGRAVTAKGAAESLKKAEEVAEKNAERAAAMVEHTANLLAGQGFRPENIRKVVLPRGGSVAATIMSYAKKGLYDAVLAGRRGIGHVMSYFIGSVSYNMLQIMKDVPVWFLEEPIESRKVLVALDNCGECMKVADHAAYVFRDVRDVEITLFHVVHTLVPGVHYGRRGDFADIDSFYDELRADAVKEVFPMARGIFESNGFDMDRVNIRIEKSGRSVAVELMSEFSRGGYGTLVMGRRGVGGWEAMFPGSVSDRVMHSDIKGCIAIAG